MKKKFITNNANDDLDKVNHATKEVLRFANQHLGQFLENFNHSCNKKTYNLGPIRCSCVILRLSLQH